jgi:two-component system nitrogen regulation response regulator GlnG
LVVAHLASLNESLAESELFGHVRGAFTGAHEVRRGLLEQADGGTLFLDEVAEISPAIQVKLLRAIEYGEVTPVGGSEVRRVDFRVISATHRDLRQQMSKGEFRHDLFYRLNTFQIQVPSLAERLDDLDELANHFVRLAASRGGSAVPRFSAEALDELRRRPWPGNIRELRNAVEFAVIQSRGGLILAEHLPPEPRPASAAADEPVVDVVVDGLRQWAEQLWSARQTPSAVYEQLLTMVERPVLEVALAHNSGHVAAAARNLGLHRITLRRKAEALGLLTKPDRPE